MRLHLGCGRTRKDGWTNVDIVEVAGVTDLVCDLDGPGLAKVLDDDSVDESLGIHFLEHLANPLSFMAELYRVTRPGGTATFEVPHGSSDDAWEDPTHRRPYFTNSWVYFGQPAYHRADYGYVGDWRVMGVQLAVDARAAAYDPQGIAHAVLHWRNVVKTMTATLEAVKPARPQDAALRDEFTVTLVPA